MREAATFVPNNHSALSSPRPPPSTPFKIDIDLPEPLLQLQHPQEHVLSLSRIVEEASNTVDLPSKLIIMAGTIADDIYLPEGRTRGEELSSPSVFHPCSKECILNAGGEALTLDQLALHAPTGANTVLLHA
ncbi:hypothetical protein B0H14DRAFT_3579196 [Mycena olivaceomarginata]|nr:hypothetical protein B0H14DRAFT_3579196 [Mycena olivaceomarginata]